VGGARRVTLEDLRLTRSNFPTLPDNGAASLSELQQQCQGAAQTIALDRLEASLAASGIALRVCTVWILETGETSPRFVIGYPG